MYKRLLTELSRFADKRSKILNQESRLWQEVSEWIAQVELSETVIVQSVVQTKPLDNSSTNTLGPQKAAEFLGLSKQTLAKLRTTGGGPEYVKIGRRVVYRRQKLEEFLFDKARPHTSSYLIHDQPRGRRTR
ncbi:MAG: helix-turn-helix domain-containing protein [Micropepsaceae bacterium]